MNLLKFHGFMLENIHENVMIFNANFINLLSSSVLRDDSIPYRANFGGGKFWRIFFNLPNFSPPNFYIFGSAMAYP